MSDPVFAVIGATGVVGKQVIAALLAHNVEPDDVRFLASERSSGEELDYGEEPLPVEPIGPALVDYRAPLAALGVGNLLDAPLVPNAARLVHLVTWPDAYSKEAVFALEPHYLRGSGAEENPKFPPLPGVEPKARLKED